MNEKITLSSVTFTRTRLRAPRVLLTPPALPCRRPQVLLYDPLFDWTMNPLKAFQLQHDEQPELNATLHPTLGGAEDMDAHRKARWAGEGRRGGGGGGGGGGGRGDFFLSSFSFKGLRL